MAAKNKPKSRRPSADAARQADIRNVFALHMQAGCRVDEILEQVHALRFAGKIREAKALLKQAEVIQKGLRALEAEVRLPSRAPE